jgi:Flp pilus assembly protein TadG
MDRDMFDKAAKRQITARVVRKIADFRSDERGAIAIFILIIFVVMLYVGGIAVDVMRFETRRVALQQTLDRAVLAAASMTDKTRTPQVIATDWFTVAGLADEFTVDFSAATIDGTSNRNKREATASAKVRSYNHFMGMLDYAYFEAPVVSAAAEGIAKVEVMLVLDITGSMERVAVTGETTTKIEALREAADEFVTIVKGADSKNGVSIGMVPYASQVNIPATLRAKYNVTKVSHWNYIANQGVPDINCIEIPTSTYDGVGLSTTLAMPMAAVADTYFGDRTDYQETTLTSSSNYLPATDYPPSVKYGPRLCTTKTDDPGTAINESEDNQLLLPTKDGDVVKERISRLTADGNTSIAVGMRWGTALVDETAIDIFSMTDSDGKIRPFKNNDETARKIIILMTDGEHVQNNFIKDAYKAGPSPFWRGTDGKFAMNFGTTYRGPFTGTLPLSNCSGWALSNTRVFFVPHLKANAVKAKYRASDPEGLGSGTAAAVTGACDPRAWLAPQSNGNPTWPQLDASGNAMKDASGNTIMVTTTQLDWSEAWRYLRLEYMIGQMNGRANISSGPSASTLRSTIRGVYLSASTMDSLLQQNCSKAKAAGIEIYGIAFAAPDNGKTQIENCATPDDEDVQYFFDATGNADLSAAFSTIASDITDLRLTQ